MAPKMTVTLKPGRQGIALEIHATTPWVDEVTKQPESHLRGFRNPGAEERARGYVEAKGWVIERRGA